MRRMIALGSLLLMGAAPPPSVDARLRAIVAPVSAAQLRADVEKLVSFGTRHTLSSQTDPNRGIGAALNWGESQFRSFGLETVRPCQTMTGERLPGPTRICDAVAIQRGTERPNDVVIITGHIDSRVTDIMNANAFEPGANDDGSGSAAVLEAARILSKHKFPGTIVYSLDSGEEQGLDGAKVIAAYAKEQGWNVIADLNNDIVGNSCGSDGVCDSTHVRIFSEGPRWQGHEDLAARQRSLGGENDAPSRNISRYLDTLADKLKIGLDVRQIWRNDRFGRGGDHSEFLNLGFPAVRFTVAVENYNWQHQDVRVENGIHYGDTVDHMDFPYLEKIAKLNIAALAGIASAPPPPEPKVEGAVSTDTTLTWPELPHAWTYKVWMRRTDSRNWERAVVPAVQPPFPDVKALVDGRRRTVYHSIAQAISQSDGGGQGWQAKTRDFSIRCIAGSCDAILPHIRVDDWVFGVSSVSADGFESPVASAVPGGAFKPYVAPPKKP